MAIVSPMPSPLSRYQLPLRAFGLTPAASQRNCSSVWVPELSPRDTKAARLNARVRSASVASFGRRAWFRAGQCPGCGPAGRCRSPRSASRGRLIPVALAALAGLRRLAPNRRSILHRVLRGLVVWTTLLLLPGLLAVAL